MTDYRKMNAFGVKMKEISTKISQKGHKEELEALYDNLSGKNPNWPIDLWDMLQTTELSLSV